MCLSSCRSESLTVLPPDEGDRGAEIWRFRDMVDGRSRNGAGFPPDVNQTAEFLDVLRRRAHGLRLANGLEIP